jgi:hypothetical protein
MGATRPRSTVWANIRAKGKRKWGCCAELHHAERPILEDRSNLEAPPYNVGGFTSRAVWPAPRAICCFTLGKAIRRKSKNDG